MSINLIDIKNFKLNLHILIKTKYFSISLHYLNN
jgi:hypothetical protein